MNYSFKGSFPVEQCITIYAGKLVRFVYNLVLRLIFPDKEIPLNTTDMECKGEWTKMDTNWDTFGRYYNIKHTIVFFFRNPLGVSYSQVAVNFYEGMYYLLITTR